MPTSQLSLRARCHCQGGLSSPRPCRIPPAPSVLTSLYMEYQRENKQRSAKTKLSFIDYLAYIGFTDPSVSVVGMDDGCSQSLPSATVCSFSPYRRRVCGERCGSWCCWSIFLTDREA